MTECRKCGAEIQFAQTANDKAMPLDMDPVDDLHGKGVQVVYPGVGGRAQCRPYDKAVEDIAEKRAVSTARARELIEEQYGAFVSHFSTCPAAGEFRHPR